MKPDFESRARSRTIPLRASVKRARDLPDDLRLLNSYYVSALRKYGIIGRGG